MKKGNITISSIFKGSKAIDKIVKGTLVVYEGWKKLIASGVPPITLQKCKGVDLVDYKIYGNSVQEGKNLIDYTTFFSRNQTSFPLTINNNGSLHYVGSYYISANADFLKSGNTYIFNFDYKCEDDIKPFWRIQYTDDTYSGQIGRGHSLTIDTNKTPKHIMLYTQMNGTIYDITYYNLQLIAEKPTPDTPIEIESVGDKTDNLFPNVITNTSYANGSTVTKNKDGSITLKKVAGDMVSIKYSFSLPAGTYTINTGLESGNMNLYFQLDRGGNDTFITATTTDNIKTFNHIGGYIRIVLFSSQNYENEHITLYPQILSGIYTKDTLPSYEPYGYKIPVVVSGENLFSEANIISNGFTKIGNKEYYAKYSSTPHNKILYKNESLYQGALTLTFDIKYVLSNNIVGTFPEIHYTDGSVFSFFDLYVINTTKPTTYTKVTRKTDANKTVDYITWSYGTGASETYIKNFGIYTQEDLPVTTNIYLDEPLRKIGDYADYIDFENKKVVRNVACRTFTGGETINVPGTAIEGYTPFRFIDTQPISYPFVCNYLPFVNSNYSTVSGRESLARYSGSGKQMFFIISNERITLNDTTTFKNWLKELNTSGKPLKVYAGLNTPIEETIELPNIPLNKASNIIEVDTSILPSNTEVKYYGKE